MASSNTRFSAELWLLMTLALGTRFSVSNLSFSNWINVDSYDVYINGDYFGTDVQNIQITTNDILRIDVIKTDDSLESTIQFENLLV